MKKILVNKLDLSGNFVAQEEEVKVKNFEDGEATTLFKAHIIAKGYQSALGTVDVVKKRHGQLQYPTLFGYSVKCRFALWHAEKDTETGKAVLWIGDRNRGGLTQVEVDYGVIIGDRIIRTDTSFLGLIVTLRSFKLGMSLKDMPFVDYLLMPVQDMIDILKETKQGWIDLRQSHRKQYAFDNMISKMQNHQFEGLI